MSSVFMKKVGGLIKKKFGSLEFTGLEISRDYKLEKEVDAIVNKTESEK